MLRLSTMAAIAAFAVLGLAMPSFLPVLTKKYAFKPTSAAAKAKCGVCHVGMTSKLNPYGADLKKAMGAVPKLTPAVLAKVESLDSDKDGVKNGAELKKGTLPGDAKSK